MALESLSFGNDITRSRLDLHDNFKILLSQTAIDDLIKTFESFAKRNPERKYSKLLGGQNEIFRGVISEIYKSLTLSFKSYLEERPLDIEPMMLGIVELLFHFSNIKSPKRPENDDSLIHEIFPKLERHFAIMQIESMEKFHSSNDKDNFFENQENEPLPVITNSDPSYDFWFSLTLRQIPVRDIPEFLELHKKQFQSDHEYSDFLEDIQIEFNHYFSEKTRKKLNRILNKEANKKELESPLLIAEQVTVISKEEVKISDKSDETDKFQGFSNEDFAKPEFLTNEIKLKAKPWQVRKFLSFFYTEKNSTDSPFLTEKEAITHLKKYGIAVPEQPLKTESILKSMAIKDLLSLL